MQAYCQFYGECAAAFIMAPLACYCMYYSTVGRLEGALLGGNGPQNGSGRGVTSTKELVDIFAITCVHIFKTNDSFGYYSTTGCICFVGPSV